MDRLIPTHCSYPAIDRLRAQFADSLPPPIAAAGRYGLVFEADFRLIDRKEKTIEILLVADEADV